MFVEASGHTAAAQTLVGRIQDAILFPLMSLLVGIAILVFLWGAFEYVYNSGSDMGRENGRRHMLYSIIGLLVMLSAFAILRIATDTFGIGIPG